MYVWISSNNSRPSVSRRASIFHYSEWCPPSTKQYYAVDQSILDLCPLSGEKYKMEQKSVSLLHSYIFLISPLTRAMLCFIKNTLNQVTDRFWVGWSAFGLFCANCQTTNILDQLAQAFRQIFYSLKLVVFVLPFFLLLYESFSHFYVVSIGGEGDEMGN